MRKWKRARHGTNVPAARHGPAGRWTGRIVRAIIRTNSVILRGAGGAGFLFEWSAAQSAISI